MMNIVEIHLLGSIRLTNGNAVIDEGRIHSRRLLALLAYLIIHRSRQVPNKVLYKQFIGDKCKNPEGTLKNLMYRLRELLKAFGPEEYICTMSGEYRWNPEIPVKVDCERFGELYEEICAEDDPEKKKELCVEAAECYNGNFSQVIAEEEWIIPWLVQNQRQYTEIVEILGDMYEKKGEWSELEQLCREALSTDPFEEELHSRLIKALQRQKKFSQAMNQYEKARKLFYENFGIWNPEKLQKAFSEPSETLKLQAMSIADLQEECRESEQSAGVFFCDYQTFEQFYRLEERRIGRTGISEHLLLLTVRRQGNLWNQAAADTAIAYGIENMEKILRRVLRAGDMVTRASQTQYAVLLAACSYEAGIMVAERIHRDFKKRMKNQKLELRYELGEVSPPWHKKGVIGE